MKKLLLFLLLTPLLMFAQQDKAFFNLDALGKFYSKGDATFEGNITYNNEVLDTNLFSISLTIRDTTSYVAISDTLALSKLAVTTVQNAYTSNNQYAVFVAADSSYAKYTFPTFVPVGDISGVNLSIEYKNISAVGDYYTYFMIGNDTTPYNSLPTKLTTDTTVIFGGISNLLGLDVLLDSAIANSIVNADATIADMLEDSTFNIRIIALDSTLSVDQIKLRAYYSIPITFSPQSDYITNFYYIRLDTIEYAPTYPIKGDMRMDTDGHFYGYDGSAWKQLDN